MFASQPQFPPNALRASIAIHRRRQINFAIQGRLHRQMNVNKNPPEVLADASGGQSQGQVLGYLLIVTTASGRGRIVTTIRTQGNPSRIPQPKILSTQRSHLPLERLRRIIPRGIAKTTSLVQHNPQPRILVPHHLVLGLQLKHQCRLV